MAESRDVVLKLVRMAMGWESDLSLPMEIDWQEVLDLAFEQGVSSIIMDGYDIFLRNNPWEVSFLIKPENKPLRGKALGRINTTECNYLNHLNALKTLTGVLNDKDIPFLILKGFSCANYYPIPNHRDCCDIDIYPAELFVESNRALTNAGFFVNPDYYRHHVLKINGVMIENHRVLCDLRGPHHQTRALERQLKKYADDSIRNGISVKIQNQSFPSVRFPIPDFNALFLPWHVSAHFAFERVTLRHLLDWALFLVHDGKKIDLAMFKNAKRNFTYGYSKIVDILTNLSIRYLNMPTTDIPQTIVDDAVCFDDGLADRVFNYFFVGKPRERDDNVWKFRLNNVKRVWNERWKYREIYNLSVVGFLYYKAKGVILKTGDEV